MTIQKKLFLSLLSKATPTKQPTFSVCVNREIYLEPTTSEVAGLDTVHEFTFTSNNINEIEISLTNKGPSDTKLDNGVITEDLLLVVQSLKIDHIDLSDKMDKISTYIGTDGTSYRTHGYITFNGTMRFKLHKSLLYTEFLAGII